MSFCTAVNCMDGRVQLPVIEFLKKKYNVHYVDTITEPGPNLILSNEANKGLIESIMSRIDISVEKHHSRQIAVIGHHDCAGNPVGKEEQIVHIKASIQNLKKRYQDVEVIGLWVDANWFVNEI